MSATIENLPNFNHQQTRIDPATEKSQTPVAKQELSPIEDRVTISSGENTFLSATMGRILSGISSLSSHDLGQIHQLDPAVVGSLLTD